MKPTIDAYPVFEANQVLTNHHLNQVFNYLDEQERLTRSNLVGIGVVCGLDITIETNGAAVNISRGCGVTSEGYLIVEPTDVRLVSYREHYVSPLDIAYPPFNAGSLPYPMWELFPVGEPNTQLLAASPTFLNEKVVVLFLELKKDDLANCSPNNCDDKGAEVTTTVRRLLMLAKDAHKMAELANNPSGSEGRADITVVVEGRLGLADLRLPRYNVPAGRIVTSVEVLSMFQHTFKQSNFVAHVRNALDSLYVKFQPILDDKYPSNPFSGFLAKFSFLKTGPTTDQQVTFIQYYYDLFDDLIRAYDEFRWKGVELMCACCPHEGLFARHLVLGPKHRHVFMPSAAVSGCESKIAELNELFARLVMMIEKFTDTPSLPTASTSALIDSQIRITPSTHGREPLSEKAIPFYYRHDGLPSIRDRWNPQLALRKRANQNLSYWSSHYTPAPPTFVRNPLGYDLEPFNFLRIEGHIGKHYVKALATLLSIRSRNRLPIDVIALRTGEFDPSIPIDLSKEECRFRDLETVYDALRDELLCSIEKTVRSFNDKPFKPVVVQKNQRQMQRRTHDVPAQEFVAKYKPLDNTYGAYVAELVHTQGLEYVSAVAESEIASAVVQSVALLHRFALVLSKDLFAVDWEKFDTLYEALKVLSDIISAKRDLQVPNDNMSFAELDRELMNVIFACRLDAFKSLREEYADRIKEVKQRQYFSHFISKNPGIQHKAGVPMGGTFILVYHQASKGTTPSDTDPFAPTRPGLDLETLKPIIHHTTPSGDATTKSPVHENAGNAKRANVTNPGATQRRSTTGSATLRFDDFARVIENIRRNPSLAVNDDVREMVAVIEQYIQHDTAILNPLELPDNRVYENVVGDLVEGTVIADFFVPYLCCSDCSPIQYLLPTPEPLVPTTPLSFDVIFGCTMEGDIADATITATGGVPPYSVQVNASTFEDLTGPIPLAVGPNDIVVKDSNDVRTAAKTITIPSQLLTIDLLYRDNSTKSEYDAEFRIKGGTPIYKSSKGTVTDDRCIVSGLKSDEIVSVVITDGRNCTTTIRLQHTIDKGCNKPCDGKAERSRYMLWLPKPAAGESYRIEGIKIGDFNIVDEHQTKQAIEGVNQLVQPLFMPSVPITAANYDGQMMKFVERVNEKVKSVVGDDVFELAYDQSMPGILSIERYVCHTFTLPIQLFLVTEQGVREEKWTYNESGLQIESGQGNKTSQSLPRFGTVKLDKCDGTTTQEPMRSIATVTATPSPTGMVLSPSITPNLSGAALFWRVTGNITHVSTDALLTLPVDMKEPYRVRLQIVGSADSWAYSETMPARSVPIVNIPRNR